MMFDLSDMTVVVTGAGRGVGFQIARAFAASKADVVLADRDLASVSRSAETIVEQGGRARTFSLDIADRPAIVDLAHDVSASSLPSFALINNAGVFDALRMEDEGSSAAWDRQIAVNLTGAFELSRAFLPLLRRSKGAIVNVSSVVAFTSSFGHVGYTASKGGLRSLTQAMCRELGPHGVRVNAVAPGFIDTGMGGKGDEAMDQWIAWHCPLGRYGLPAEVAQPIVFLASPLASYVNGVILPVDGGYLSI